MNGDDPEACLRAARLAFGFRQAFHKDVVIDIVCYRRFGHNEGDDPSYTQPRMYAIIESKRSVRKRYTEVLVQARRHHARRGREGTRRLRGQAAGRAGRDPPGCPAEGDRASHAPARRDVARPMPDDRDRARRRPRAWPRARPECPRGSTCTRSSPGSSSNEPRWWQTTRSTGLSARRSPSARSCSREPTSGSPDKTPDGAPSASVTPCSSTTRPAPNGYLWRISRRRTSGKLGRFAVHDSLLSEYAALGFEYGYSVESPEALVCWEAQFGDFANGAQIIIDNFLVAAEDKWGQRCGLVMLLAARLRRPGP